MGQRKKIPDSTIIKIMKDIDEGKFKLRVKARELEIAPSSLHARIKKLRNQQSIHNDILTIPEVKKTEQLKRPNTITPEVKKTEQLKRPNTITPDAKKTEQLKRPNINKIKNKSKIKKKRPTTMEGRNLCQDMNILVMRNRNKYCPTELFHSIHWTYTGKSIRIKRNQLLKNLIELFKEDDNDKRKFPYEFYAYTYWILSGKPYKYDESKIIKSIITLLKKQIKMSIVRGGYKNG